MKHPVFITYFITTHSPHNQHTHYHTTTITTTLTPPHTHKILLFESRNIPFSYYNLPLIFNYNTHTLSTPRHLHTPSQPPDTSTHPLNHRTPLHTLSNTTQTSFSLLSLLQKRPSCHKESEPQCFIRRRFEDRCINVGWSQ